MSDRTVSWKALADFSKAQKEAREMTREFERLQRAEDEANASSVKTGAKADEANAKRQKGLKGLTDQQEEFTQGSVKAEAGDKRLTATVLKGNDAVDKRSSVIRAAAEQQKKLTQVTKDAVTSEEAAVQADRNRTAELSKLSQSLKAATAENERHGRSASQMSAAVRQATAAHKEAKAAAESETTATQNQQKAWLDTIRTAARLDDAEQKLAQTRRSSSQDSSSLRDAELRVADARLASEKAATKLSLSNDRLSESHSRVERSSTKVVSSNRDLERSHSFLGRAMLAVEGSGGGLAGMFKKLGSSAGGARGGVVALEATLSLLKLPVILAGLGQLVAILSSLAGGAIAVAGALSPLVGLLGTIPTLAVGAATALGTVLTAFMGVGDALKANAAAEKSAAADSAAAAKQRLAAAKQVATAVRSLKDAQQAQADAAVAGARTVAEAQRSLKDAQQAQVDVAIAGARNVQSAERNLQSAQEASLQAQLDLTQARKDAIQNLKDLKQAVQDEALSEERAALTVDQAKARLQEVLRNPAATALEKRDAELSVREAEAALARTREQAKQSAAELKKAQALGIEKSTGVVAAKKAEKNAIQGVSDAQAALVLAVRDAARNQQDAARNTADAQRALSDAVTKAARGQQDAARNVADAQRALTEAYKNQAEVAKTASAAATKAAQAMAALSPAGQKFVKVLESLKGNLKTIQAASQAGLFPGLGTALQILSQLTPLVANAFNRMGKAMGAAAVNVAKIMTTPLFKKQFAELTNTNVKLMDALGRAAGNVVQTLMNIAVAAQPLVLWLSRVAEGWTQTWLQMTSGEGNRAKMEKFFERTRQVLQLVGDILKHLVGGFVSMASAGSAAGMDLLTTFDTFVAKWDAWTKSAEGQNTLKNYFDNAKEVVKEVARLIHDVVLSFAQLGADSSTAGLVHQIRTQLLPAFQALFDSVSEGLLPSVISLATNFLKMFAALSNNSGVKNVVDGMNALLEAVNALLDRVPLLSTALGYLLTGLVALKVVSGIAGLFKPLIGVIGFLTTAIETLAFVFMTSSLVILGWIAVIALIIAAVVVAAYFIHKYWDQILGFFKSVGTAILGWLKSVWAKIQSAIVDPVVRAFHAVVGWLGRFWAGFVGVLGKILTFLKWWGTNLYNYWIAPLVKIAAYVVKFFVWLSQKFMQALTVLLNWIKKAWNAVYNHFLAPLGRAFAAIGKWFAGLWTWFTTKITQLLTWIQKNFAKAQGHITKPFQDAWNWVVKTFGPGISKAFATIWAGIKKGAEGFKTALGAVWTAIKEVFAAPVRFVVNTVLKGLIGAYNQLVQMLGLGNANDPKNRGISIKAPTINFAKGGVYPGYTPGKDIGVVGVSGGEAIMRPEWTRAVGKGHVDEMNAAARRGGVSGVRRHMEERKKKRRGYAKGGVVPRNMGDFVSGGAVKSWRGERLNTRTIAMILAAEALPQMQNWLFHITQGSYSTRVAASFGTHAGGGVFDTNTNSPGGWSTPVWSLRRVGFAAWHRTPEQGFPHHIHSVAINDDSESPQAKKQVTAFLAGGNGLGGKDDGPHVTVDPKLAARFMILANQQGTGTGPSLFDSLASWVKTAIANPLGWLKSKIGGPVKDLVTRFGDNNVTKMMMAVPNKIMGFLGDRITSAVGGLIGASTSVAPQGIIGGPVVRAKVIRAAQAYGWGSGSQWEAIDWIISHESGWNPNAQNPSSTAYGLFQFLNSTWAATGYPKSSDPAIQAAAGMKYIKTKYGTPVGAKAFWQAHHWYDEGGVIPSTKALFTEGSESGDVQAMRRGGKVPGTGSGDKVPALLEPGEFVVRKQVAQKFKSQLEELNSRKIGTERRTGKKARREGLPVQRFHAGGPVLGIRPGMSGTVVRALRYLFNMPTGASPAYGKWDAGFDRVARQTGAWARLSNSWKVGNRDPRFAKLSAYLKSGAVKSYAQGRDYLGVNDATMMKVWEGMRATTQHNLPVARWKKLDQGYMAKRGELLNYVGILNKGIGLGAEKNTWTSHGRAAMKHVFEHAFGVKHDTLEYRPWAGFTVVEAAAAAAKASNDQQRIFNTALETLAGWGLTALVDDLLEKGVAEGLNIAFDAAKNRPAAQILNDQLALAKLLNPEDQGNILKLISMFSSPSGSGLGLRDVARNLGLSDLDTVLLIEKGLKANRFSTTLSRMTKVRADIASYRAGTFYGASGGQVPGSGHGDKVPAMLEPGEFVLRRKAAESLGLERLEDLNHAEIQKFKAGGLVQQFQLMSQPTLARVPGLSNAVAQAANAGGGDIITNNYNYDVDINNPVAEKSTVSLTKALQRQAAMNSSAGGSS